MIVECSCYGVRCTIAMLWPLAEVARPLTDRSLVQEARLEGFEPTTFSFEDCCSVH